LVGAGSPQQIMSAVEARALPPLDEALQQQIRAVLA
ncbi:L-glyceraldehyde 3-phosphate reductase, partial [Aeromonas media]|nr:L-glyceraldehyde 3-phosphate reductase [Aeromonas media]